MASFLSASQRVSPWLPWAAAAVSALWGATVIVSNRLIPTPPPHVAPPAVESINPIQWIWDSPLIKQYGSYAYNVFGCHPDLIEKIQRTRPGFDPWTQMAVSSPTNVAQLKDGRSLVLIHGCRKHDCPSQTVIAINAQSEEIYVFETQYVDPQTHSASERFWGQPDTAVKQALVGGQNVQPPLDTLASLYRSIKGTNGLRCQ